MKWQVSKIWPDQDVFILGGGPSIPQQFNIPQEIINKVRSKEISASIYSDYMKQIHDKNVIGINAAFMFGNWIDILFFGDIDFYRCYTDQLKNFTNLKLTCREELDEYNNQPYEDIYVIPKNENKRKGISDDPASISWNLNSGSASISIAANAGAKRIILLGFDMNPIPNNQHWWHRLYQYQDPPQFNRHIQGFEQIKQDADKRGIEILNASPDSAITQFKKINLQDIL